MKTFRKFLVYYGYFLIIYVIGLTLFTNASDITKLYGLSCSALIITISKD